MLALAAAGEPEGSWLCAEQQTAGRGRMGREWSSPPGNFYGSTIVRLRPSDPPAPSLAFVAAVSLFESLKSAAPSLPLSIKWPNDILCDGAKLSGILLERAGEAVVIGIGVNLAHHPNGLERPVTSLAALGCPVPPPRTFSEELSVYLAGWVAKWHEGHLVAILDVWKAYAHSVETALTVNLPDGTIIDGQYDGLEADASLRLRLADGTIRAIHAGDVFLV